MMIHLKHDKHGVKVAYLEAEAQADERAGWVRFDPAATPKPVKLAGDAQSPDPEKPRRGRPRKEQ